MKAIISHDVDHITVFEHKNDLIIPKFLIRSLIELKEKRITLKEYKLRLNDIYKNKWQNILELIEFEKINQIPSTFFIGVSNGKGLSYSINNAAICIKEILEAGFDVGVHGIAFEDYNKIKNEYELFKNISGLKKFGIRMHYLRNTNYTLDMLSNIGYQYDTSKYELKNPYKIGNMWEFPLLMMDGYVIEGSSKWQSLNIEKAKERTLKLIENVQEKDIKYITILFHDRYFSDSFWTWKAWYIWLIEYLRERKISFISYKEAINELNEKEKLY